MFEQLEDQSWEGEAGAGVRARGGWDLSLGGLSCGGSLLDQPGPSCVFAPRLVMGAMMGGPLPLRLITRGFPKGGAGVPFRTRGDRNLGRHTHRCPRAGLALRGRRSPDLTSSALDCVMGQPGV